MAAFRIFKEASYLVSEVIDNGGKSNFSKDYARKTAYQKMIKKKFRFLKYIPGALDIIRNRNFPAREYFK